MARYQYGGQALIEGVLMRGRNALAVALRHPDGSIVWASERLDLGLRARKALKMPFLRGLVLLYDTLVTGTRWLVRSATLQALAEEDGGTPTSGAGATSGTGAGTTSGLSTIIGGVVAAAAAVLTGPALCAAAGDGDGDRDGGGQPQAPAAYTDPDAAAPAQAPNAEQGMGKGYTVAVGGMLLLSLVLGIGLFFLLPLLLAQATIGRVDQGLGLQLSEGSLRR